MVMAVEIINSCINQNKKAVPEEQLFYLQYAFLATYFLLPVTCKCIFIMPDQCNVTKLLQVYNFIIHINYN
jgi:hypothetical protein